MNYDSTTSDHLLAAENERLKFALQAAEIGTWDYNLETGYVEWSPICKQLFGLPPNASITAAELLAQVHPEDREWVELANKLALTTNKNREHNITFRTISAHKQRWVQAKGKTYVNANGQVVRFAGTAQDVTATIESRQQYQVSQERFRTLIEQAPVATCLFVGRNMTVEIANGLMLNFWGKDQAILGMPLVEAVPELIGQPFLEILDHVFTTGKPYVAQNAAAELPSYGVTGTYYFDFTYKPLFNSQGEVYAVLDMAVDVTERVLAQQRINAAQQQILASFEQAPVAIAVIDKVNLTFQMANPSYANLVGRRTDELVGKSLLEALPELTGQGFDQLLNRVINTGTPYSANEVAVELVRQDRLETIYVNFSYQPQYLSDTEQISGVLVVANDITQQVLSRKTIEASEAKLRSIIATAPAAMGLFVGRDLVVELPNQAFIDIVGKGPDISGKPLREVMPELLTENQPFLQILDQVYTSGKRFQSFGSQVKIVRNGVLTDNYYNITYSPLFDSEGKVYAILDIAIDVTEEIKARREAEESEARYRILSKELENRVQQRTQELTYANQDLKRSNDNLQQFAYIASHDLQEPLRKIQAFSSLLHDQYSNELGPEGKDLLLRITSAGARMSTLIKDLLTYSRIATRQQSFGPVSLTIIVANVLNTLEWEIVQHKAQVNINDLPVVNGEASQLGQLFQNLLSNALKFTKPGEVPHVSIQYRQVDSSELSATVRPTSDALKFHQISVSDQGIGFDEKYLDRIFLVFQRLHGKNEFPGTGVGLAICQRVVENHGGFLTATSKVGDGATFYVYLPV